MAAKIVPLLPRHTVCCEPFAGAATILFAKPWPRVTNTDHYREAINDTNQDVVNFFQQLRDNGGELTRLLQLTPYSQHEYKIRNEIDESTSDLEKARKFYVNVMQSFANKLDGGWGTSTYGRNHADNWKNKVCSLEDFVGRMMSVYIACEDALRFIERWDSPHTLFYCDPPYPNTNQGHYKEYTLDDFRALVQALDACEANIVLSCYDVMPDEMPQDWERFEFNATMSAARHKNAAKARTEVVWRRFNRIPVRPEIAKLYRSGAFDAYAFPAIEQAQPELF